VGVWVCFDRHVLGCVGFFAFFAFFGFVGFVGYCWFALPSIALPCLA
jgi:hypothetical protein